MVHVEVKSLEEFLRLIKHTNITFIRVGAVFYCNEDKTVLSGLLLSARHPNAYFECIQPLPKPKRVLMAKTKSIPEPYLQTLFEVRYKLHQAGFRTGFGRWKLIYNT